jgi:hypothetical protein
MGIDIRFPIGLMFGLIGLLLSVYGFSSDKSIYARSLEINVNLIWGLVMMLFAVVMLGLAARAHRTPHVEEPKPAPEAGPR